MPDAPPARPSTLRGPATPETSRAQPGPPRAAPPCGTSGLRSLPGPGRPPRPISLLRSLRGLSPRRAGRPGGARGRGEPGGPGGRRRRSPQPRGSTSSRSALQLRRRRRRRGAAQWERAGGDSPRTRRPGPHARAPAGPHLLPAAPSPAPHALPGAGAPLPTPTIPRFTHHLAFRLLSLQEPWKRPLRRRQPLQRRKLSFAELGKHPPPVLSIPTEPQMPAFCH